MGNCPICKAPIEAWETLCKMCWRRAEDGYKLSQSKGAEIIERLKGQAKLDLMDLMREACRRCEKFKNDLSDPSCEVCAFKEKEKLIRAFLE